MWTSFLYGRPFESVLRSLRDAGYNSADLSVEHLEKIVQSDSPHKHAVHWRDFAREIGLPLLQTHLYLDSDLSMPSGNERDQQIELLKRELEITVEMGIPAAVIHVSKGDGKDWGHTPEAKTELIVKALNELTAFLKGTSTRLALENLFCSERRATDLLHLIELADNSVQLGICMDTGHLHCTGGNQTEFLDEAAEHLIALHIADNTGVADYHMLPLGRGTIDWHTFMRKLKTIPYPGIFNFEASGENSPIYPEILDAKLKYSAKVAETLINME